MIEVDIEKQLAALADFVLGQHGEDVDKALPEFLDEVAASGLLDTMFRQNENLSDLRIGGKRLSDLVASGEVKMPMPWVEDPIARPFVAVMVGFFTHYAADWQTRR